MLRTIPSLVDEEHERQAFDIIEAFTIAFFTFDFVAKFLVCPDKLRFFYTVFRWLELFSIVPYYISLAYTENATMRLVRDISRVFRVCSLLNLFYKSSTLNTIVKALKASFREIIIFLIYFSMVVMIFSTMIFYLESGDPQTDFLNIPQTFWFTVITMRFVIFVFFCNVVFNCRLSYDVK
jgi:hypothetical protein